MECVEGLTRDPPRWLASYLLRQVSARAMLHVLSLVADRIVHGYARPTSRAQRVERPKVIVMT